MRTLTVFLLIALAAPMTADAQSLFDRARSAVTGQSVEDRADDMNQRSLSGAPTPAALLGAYLGSVRIEKNNALGSFLEFNDTQFVFLPESEGTATLTRDGERVATYSWETYTARGPFYQMEPLQLTWPQSDYSALGYALEQPGAYEVIYEAGGEPFWKMPFTVTASGGDDPYNPDPTFRLDGLWNDHAYVLHDERESGTWIFKPYLHPDDIRTDMNEYVRVTSDASGEVVLVGGSKNQHVGFISNGNWGRKDYELERPRPGRQYANGDYYDNEPFRANTERLDDGAYTLTYYLGDEPHGRYPFQIESGEMVSMAAQASGADPMTRIDGGGSAVWLVRE